DHHASTGHHAGSHHSHSAHSVRRHGAHSSHSTDHTWEAHLATHHTAGSIHAPRSDSSVVHAAAHLAAEHTRWITIRTIHSNISVGAAIHATVSTRTAVAAGP